MPAKVTVDLQVVTWVGDDCVDSRPVNTPLITARIQYGDETDDELPAPPAAEDEGIDYANASFAVWAFGRTSEGESVCVRVDGITPKFYLRCDTSDLDDAAVEAVRRVLRAKVGKAWKNLQDHLVSHKPVWAKDMWGFTNSTAQRFLELRFKTRWAFRKAVNLFLYKRDSLPDSLFAVKTYEGRLDPILRFIHDRKLKAAGWISVSGRATDSPSTVCDIELEARPEGVGPATRPPFPAPLTELSFDIETYSHDGRFPNPRESRNPVFQIGLTVKKADGPRRILLNLGPCTAIAQAETRCYSTEKELLEGFAKTVREIDPDIIHHFNGDKFDWRYVFVRADMLDADINDLSRFSGHVCFLNREKFSSGAYGTNEYFRVDVPGRLGLDLLEYVKRYGDSYEQYKLDAISQHELGEQKDDVSPKQIFAFYASGDPDKVAVVGKYCLQDTHLVQRLVDKLDVLTALFQMSSEMLVPVPHLLTKGQSVRVYSMIARKAHTKNFLIPDATDTDDSPFKGAMVIPPKAGAYWDPVVVLDFASLYPTIISAHKICYSTLVMDPRYENIPGVEYERVEWTEDDGTRKSYQYVQNSESILPELQMELFALRKSVKKQKAAAQDEYTKKVLTKMEMAIKTSMNSIYGFTSARMCQLKPLGESITATGRSMIGRTKLFMETEFVALAKERGWLPQDSAMQPTVVAGDTDSVFVRMPGISIGEAIELGQQAETVLTDVVFARPPIRMEYEKVYCPYILQGKKMYVGKQFGTDPTTPVKTDSKGMATVRRNYCAFVRNVLKQVIGDVMSEPGGKGVLPAVKTLEDSLERLVSNKVPMKELVVTSKLAETYANENIPHVQFAKRLRERDEGSAPRVGERFPWVRVVSKDGAKEFLESPEYAEEHGMRVDALFYMQNQLRNPMTAFLGVLGVGQEIERIFDRYEAVAERTKKNHASIISYLEGTTSAEVMTKARARSREAVTRKLNGVGPAGPRKVQQKLDGFFTAK